MGEWMLDDDGEVYSNDKRTGFLPYFDLPKSTDRPLELSLCLSPYDEEERATLLGRGWRVKDACDTTGTPWDYQRYVQHSRGEFSCVKPSCVRLQNAWISDRTLCYLASGKPAIVEHTGPSRMLPDAEGLLRFRDFDEAVRLLAEVESHYENHCNAARALAESHFDARQVARAVLEKALS
jgi:glycosyltransferase involved in cell wall biosynthesis